MLWLTHFFSSIHLQAAAGNLPDPSCQELLVIRPPQATDGESFHWHEYQGGQFMFLLDAITMTS